MDNVTLIFKKDRKEGQGNYRLVRLFLMPSQSMLRKRDITVVI